MPAPASSRGYARRALELFARDAPRYHAALVDALRALPGTYHVGREEFAIVVSAGVIAFDDARPRDALLDVFIAPPDLIELIDGTAMVEKLLAEERLVIFAPADALLLLARLVATMVEGGLRLRSLHDLFDGYRAWVASGERDPNVDLDRLL